MERLMKNNNFAIAMATGDIVSLRLFRHSAMAWIAVSGNKKLLVIKCIGNEINAPDGFNLEEHKTDAQELVVKTAEYFNSCGVTSISQLSGNFF